MGSSGPTQILRTPPANPDSCRRRAYVSALNTRATRLDTIACQRWSHFHWSNERRPTSLARIGCASPCRLTSSEAHLLPGNVVLRHPNARMTHAPIRCKFHRVLCGATRPSLSSKEPIAIQIGAEFGCIAVVAGFSGLLIQARS